MKAFYSNVGIGVFCQFLGVSRQAFYDKKTREAKKNFESSIILELVNRERKVAKRVGGKKLYLMLKSELLQNDVKLGRDQFLNILSSNNLLVKRRRRHVVTTLSRHRFHTYKNKAKDLKIDCAEQLWVSDITYLRVLGSHVYLSLVTDAYSRKVVGYHLSKKIDTNLCLTALEMALHSREFPKRKLMHHSDRGVQYCSAKYVNLLMQNEIQISMTENSDPLENPLAERMNRTFKDVFGLDAIFENFVTANNAVAKAVLYYNKRLPHLSINNLTPEKAHLKTGKIKQKWRWYWKEKQAVEKTKRQSKQAELV